MICSILVQFTGNAKYRPSSGEVLKLPVSVNLYGNFVSELEYGKIFAGIINWFFNAWKAIENQEGHLMSDMAGSIQAKKAGKEGSGIPGTVMSTLKELSALRCFKDTNFAENLRKAYQNGIGKGGKQLDLGIFNFLFEGAKSNKVDLRTEVAVKHELQRQLVPININEIIVRAFYFIRRFIEQMETKETIMDVDWKELLPFNNRTIERMMTVSTGTFVVVDQCDALINGAKEAIKTAKVTPTGEACLVAFMKGYILKVNFVGIGRFTIAVGTEIYMDIRKNRLELATASGEIAKTSIEVKQTVTEAAGNHAKVNQKLEVLRMRGTDDDTLFIEEDCSSMVEFTVNDITIENLTEAASAIFSSTEKDFAKIKSEKWYQTIFYNLPFCQNGQKYVVKDIKSLAKLQQLFLEIITKIDRDTQRQFVDVINAVITQRNAIAQTQKEIKQLKGMYEVLLERIRGIEEQQSLDTLDEDDVQVLVLLLMEFKDDKNLISDEVKKYNRGIMKALRRGMPIGELRDELIAELKAPKLVYRCFLEQCAVAGMIDNRERLPNMEIEKYFDIGIVQKEMIEKSVKSELEAFGKDYFYDKYEGSQGIIGDSGFVIALNEQETYSVIEKQKTVTESAINACEFSDADLSELYEIANEYGLVKDKTGYKKLTEIFFDITFEAYLGRYANLPLYFTTVCVYAQKADGEWLAIDYADLDTENIHHDRNVKDNKHVLEIWDYDKETSFSCSGDDDNCDKLVGLLQQLKNVKVSEDDGYCSSRFNEDSVYGEILVDFLKMVNGNEVEAYKYIAVLRKCAEFLGPEDDEDFLLLKELCEYALSSQEVTEDSLIQKIATWKDTLDAYRVNVQMALLFKDFVEILQFLKAKEYEITEREKRFLKTLAKAAEIDDFDKFTDMVRLPYWLISQKGDRYLPDIMSIENYACEQTHIPFQILDNEANGLWSTLHQLTYEIYKKEKNENTIGAKFVSHLNREYLIGNDYLIRTKDNVDKLWEQASRIAYFNLCVGMSWLVMKTSWFEEEIITAEQIGTFLANSGLANRYLEIAVDNIYACFRDENWNKAIAKYYEYDKRKLGKEMVDMFFQ